MTPYNIIKVDISSGKADFPIGTSGGYIALLDAPANANVSIKLNDQFGDAIPLKVTHGIEAKGVTKVYISADAVAGGVITLVQAKTSDNFKMITPAFDANVENIGGYEQAALYQLGKMFEPHEPPEASYASSASTTQVTLLNKTLTCDKVRITLNSGLASTTAMIRATIAGLTVIRLYSNGTNETKSDSIEIEGVNGKVLDVAGSNAGGDPFFCYIEEFYLKE